MYRNECNLTYMSTFEFSLHSSNKEIDMKVKIKTKCKLSFKKDIDMKDNNRLIQLIGLFLSRCAFRYTFISCFGVHNECIKCYCEYECIKFNSGDCKCFKIYCISTFTMYQV